MDVRKDFRVDDWQGVIIPKDRVEALEAPEDVDVKTLEPRSWYDTAHVCTSQGNLPSCFPAGTKVLMEDFSYKDGVGILRFIRDLHFSPRHHLIDNSLCELQIQLETGCPVGEHRNIEHSDMRGKRTPRSPKMVATLKKKGTDPK